MATAPVRRAAGLPFDEARFRQPQPHLAAFAGMYVPHLLHRTGLDVRTVLAFASAYQVNRALRRRALPPPLGALN